MSNTREDASTAVLHKRTSDRMAEILWKQFTHKFPDKLKGADYSFRLRIAHTLILRFYHVYFNRTFKTPTSGSQVWLIRQVMNHHNLVHWPIVSIKSG